MQWSAQYSCTSQVLQSAVIIVQPVFRQRAGHGEAERGSSDTIYNLVPRRRYVVPKRNRAFFTFFGLA